MADNTLVSAAHYAGKMRMKIPENAYLRCVFNALPCCTFRLRGEK